MVLSIRLLRATSAPSQSGSERVFILPVDSAQLPSLEALPGVCGTVGTFSALAGAGRGQSVEGGGGSGQSIG